MVYVMYQNDKWIKENVTDFIYFFFLFIYDLSELHSLFMYENFQIDIFMGKKHAPKYYNKIVVCLNNIDTSRL